MRNFKTPIVTEPYKFTWVDVELPNLRPHDILVKVRACGICGSDLHLYKGLHPYAPLPACTGHEIAGEVVEIGNAVTSVKVRDRVAMLPPWAGGQCGQCFNCMRGDYIHCLNPTRWEHRIDGKTVARYPSGFGEYIWGGEHAAFKIPKDLSFEEASFMDPLSVAVHGMKHSNMNFGDIGCILGAGPIGLMLLQVAKVAGFTKLFVSETSEYRRRLAEELGADATINPSEEDPVKKIEALTGNGVDVAFECVGIEDTLLQSLKMLKRGGTSVVIGIFEKPKVKIDLPQMMRRENTMTTVWGAAFPRDFQDSIALISSRKVNVRKLITHKFPEEKTEDAMRLLLEKKQNPIKVLITH